MHKQEYLMEHRTLVPSKRLRNWHRHQSPGVPLKQFVRGLLEIPAGAADEMRAVARMWLASKAAS